MSEYDYTLHDVITGKKNDVTKRKLWWMKKLAGPGRRRYARMLMDLPPLENEE